MNASDFSPTKEQITLHGLGFLQIKLPGRRRLHVWHPSLPRRACFEHSAIHNHRFSFRSTVLVGTQVNRRYAVEAADGGAFDLISHDGPRSALGGRQSYIAGRVDVHQLTDETYGPGDSYVMPELHYHETPNTDIVVTLLEKLTEGTVHASSLIRHGFIFDQDFDRHMLPPAAMWDVLAHALQQADTQ